MKFKKLKKKHFLAKLIIESPTLDWKEKYNLIFSDKMSAKLQGLFTYHDPDTSYEEDVMVWWNAFNEYYEKQTELNIKIT